MVRNSPKSTVPAQAVRSEKSKMPIGIGLSDQPDATVTAQGSDTPIRDFIAQVKRDFGPVRVLWATDGVRVVGSAQVEAETNFTTEGER